MILQIIHHVSSLFTNADFPDNTASVQNQSNFNIEAGGNPSWKNSKWPLNTYTNPGSQEKAAGSAWMMAPHNINSSWLYTLTILLAGVLFPLNK